jgi:hypothetical protein
MGRPEAKPDVEISDERVMEALRDSRSEGTLRATL